MENHVRLQIHKRFPQVVDDKRLGIPRLIQQFPEQLPNERFRFGDQELHNTSYKQFVVHRGPAKLRQKSAPVNP